MTVMKFHVNDERRAAAPAKRRTAYERMEMIRAKQRELWRQDEPDVLKIAQLDGLVEKIAQGTRKKDKAEPAPVAPLEAQQVPPENKRAERRIKQLLEKNKELVQENDELRQENDEWPQKYKELQVRLAHMQSVTHLLMKRIPPNVVDEILKAALADIHAAQPQGDQ